MIPIISLAFATVAHASVISLRVYTFNSGSCSNLVDSEEYCNEQACNFLTCQKLKSFYEAQGMTNWGECFGEQNNTKVVCEDVLGDVCEYNSICTTVCTSSDTQCSGTCELTSTLLPENTTCGELKKEYENKMPNFDSFGPCFTFNNTDMQITCEDGPDQQLRFAMIAGSMVFVGILLILMIVVYFRSRKQSTKSLLIKQKLNTFRYDKKSEGKKIESGATSAFI